MQFAQDQLAENQRTLDRFAAKFEARVKAAKFEAEMKAAKLEAEVKAAHRTTRLQQE